MGIVEKTVDDIKSMRIKGANRIALAGLKALKQVASESGFVGEFTRACNLLVNARPTAVVLYNLVEKIRKEKTIESINKAIYYVENVGSVIGTKNYKIIKNNSTILTHCHSTDVVEFFRTVHENKIKFKVIVTETRPLYQGMETAQQLSDIGIPITYIIDSATGFFVKDIDMMIFGCDAIRRGGVVNKVGTYPLTVLAKENKIPVYLVGGTIKFDKRKKFVIEERNGSEVLQKEIKNVKVRNPVFDITPWKFVTGVITEKGIIKPRQAMRLL